METIFITDSEDFYQKNNDKKLVLINGALIIKSNFIDQILIYKINSLNNFAEEKAGEKALLQLQGDIKMLKNSQFDSNLFLDLFDTEIKLYSILYPIYCKFILKKELFLIWLCAFLNTVNLKANKLEFNLSNDLSLISLKDLTAITGTVYSKINFRNSNINISNGIKTNVKNWYYYLYKCFLNKNKIQYVDNSKKIPIMLFAANIPHQLDVFSTFFDLINAEDKYCLHVILYEYDSSFKVSKHFNNIDRKNIQIHEFTEYRNFSKKKHKSIMKSLQKLDPKYSNIRVEVETELNNIEVHYTWMKECFEAINPKVSLFLSTNEFGRILSNVSRYFNTPSVQVDYGLFSDSYQLQSNIKFDIRASISEAVISMWKKRRDLSVNYKPIGFCKLDKIKSIESLESNRNLFLLNNSIDGSKKTIFFASTWAVDGTVYNEEKRIIIEYLSDVCYLNGWNLFIKLHPLESDGIVNNIFKINNRANQFLFNHDQIELSEVIFYSDIIITQMSSIVLEALYYEKPFCMVSVSPDRIAYPGIIDNENLIFPLFTDFNKLERYIRKVFTNNFNKEELDLYRIERNRILFRSDNCASIRLLDIVNNLV